MISTLIEMESTFSGLASNRRKPSLGREGATLGFELQGIAQMTGSKRVRNFNLSEPIP